MLTLLATGVASAAPAAPAKTPVAARDTLVRADSVAIAPAGRHDTLVRADSLAKAPPVARPRARADSAAADTTGRAAAEAKRRANRLVDQPRMVMLRSLLVPGWGQLHNHAWFKCVGVAGGEGWLLSTLLRDRTDLVTMRDAANAAAAAHDEAAYSVAVNRYNDRLNGFIGRQWLLGGVLAYALVDAYVDAHFRRFDIDFRTDPALPPGSAPDPGRVGTSVDEARVRFSLGWTF